MPQLINTQEESLGKVDISSQVIETIAKLSTKEVEGVVSLSKGFTSEIAEMIGRQNVARGIKVVQTDNEVKVDVSVIIKNGYQIPSLAEQIQQNIQSSIENMTEVKVAEVNVHVDGIDFQTEK